MEAICAVKKKKIESSAAFVRLLTDKQNYQSIILIVCLFVQ